MNVYPIYVGIIFQFILHVYTPPQHAFFKLNLTPNKKPLIFYWDPHNRLLRASIVDDLFPRKRWTFPLKKYFQTKAEWQDSCLSRHTASILEGACG